jgi:hypothetical protein
MEYISINKSYFFTFSEEDRHPQTREPMEGYYVEIKAEDEEAGRFAMFSMFHDSWAIMYKADEFNKASCPKGLYAICIAKPFNIPKQT